MKLPLIEGMKILNTLISASLFVSLMASCSTAKKVRPETTNRLLGVSFGVLDAAEWDINKKSSLTLFGNFTVDGMPTFDTFREGVALEFENKNAPELTTKLQTCLDIAKREGRLNIVFQGRSHSHKINVNQIEYGPAPILVADVSSFHCSGFGAGTGRAQLSAKSFGSQTRLPAQEDGLSSGRLTFQSSMQK